MSKNIFLFNKIGATNQLEVNDLTVNQDLKLNGADTDCLLKTDSNSNVVTFTNGPARYLIEVDGTTLKPEWTNSIRVDEIETNLIKINNTQQADILVIGDNLGNVERLAKGPNNYVLCCDDFNTFGLNYKSVYQLLNLQAGQVFSDNIGFIYNEKTYTNLQPAENTFTTNSLLKSDNVPVVVGRKYKITYNFISTQASGSGTNVFDVYVQFIGLVKSYATPIQQNCETIIHVFTSPTSGLINIALTGGHTPTSALGKAGNIMFLCEPLGV
jgi:hypothetical protein